MKQLISWLKSLFKKPTNTYKPVRRVDVLRYAKKHKDFGLCMSLHFALRHYYPDFGYMLDSKRLRKAFPLFTEDNALKFGATGNLYWWPKGVWDTGREAFLDWLIEQYKDDKTDLKTIVL